MGDIVIFSRVWVIYDQRTNAWWDGEAWSFNSTDARTYTSEQGAVGAADRIAKPGQWVLVMYVRKVVSP